MDYKISVIIPMYNVEEYIGECLDSIINQTIGIKHIEVIIVDDCSSDNSLNIVKEYAKKYPSIKLVEQEKNQGPGVARNTGLKHVNSDYVTFMDSDDFISENTYEVTLNKFREHGCDLVIYKYKLFSKIGKEYPLDIHQEIYKKSRLIENIEDVPEIIFATSPCNKIYPKKFIPFLNFPTAFYEDNVVAAEISFNAEKIFVTDECTYFYRIRENENESRTQKTNKMKCIDLARVNADLYNLLEDYPDYKVMITWLNLHFSQYIVQWMLAWNFSGKERRQIYKNSRTFLKNSTDADINSFNTYFPQYPLNCSELICEVRDKPYLMFLVKYNCYLPAKRKLAPLKKPLNKVKLRLTHNS